MSMYAQMDGNKVVNIIIGDMEWLSKQTNPEQYIEFTLENPASINGDYIDGIFYAVQTQPSWIRNNTGGWSPPIEYPNDGKIYFWNENILNWEEING